MSVPAIRPGSTVQASTTAAEAPASPRPATLPQRAGLPVTNLPAQRPAIGSRASIGQAAAPTSSHVIVDPRPVVGPRDLGEALQAVEAKLTSWLGRASSPPSAQIAITFNGKLVYAKALGMREVRNLTPTSNDTLYQINSMTKSLTDASIMQLVEAGKLSLDTPVVSIVPEFARVSGPASEVTVRQLMSHTALLTRDMTFDNWNGANFWTTRAWPSWNDYAARLGEASVRANPKREFKYSNVGLAILGQVVSRVSGVPYADYVRTHIFDKLGMKNSMFAIDDANIARTAVGYSAISAGTGPATRVEQPVIRDPGALISVAGCRSTATDVATWVSFLRDPTSVQGVLSPASVAQMKSPTTFDPSNFAQIGFGLFTTPLNIGNVAFGHTGSGVGFSSAMRESSDGSFGVVILTNDFSKQPNKMVDMIMAELVDVAKSAPAGAPPRDPAWAAYLGNYSNTIGRVSVVRTNVSGDLTMDGAPLAPVTGEPDTFEVTGGDRTSDIYEHIFFQRDATGAVINACVGGTTPEHSQHFYGRVPEALTVRFTLLSVLTSSMTVRRVSGSSACVIES